MTSTRNSCTNYETNNTKNLLEVAMSSSTKTWCAWPRYNQKWQRKSPSATLLSSIRSQWKKFDSFPKSIKRHSRKCGDHFDKGLADVGTNTPRFLGTNKPNVFEHRKDPAAYCSFNKQFIRLKGRKGGDSPPPSMAMSKLSKIHLETLWKKLQRHRADMCAQV